MPIISSQFGGCTTRKASSGTSNCLPDASSINAISLILMIASSRSPRTVRLWIGAARAASGMGSVASYQWPRTPSASNDSSTCARVWRIAFCTSGRSIAHSAVSSPARTLSDATEPEASFTSILQHRRGLLDFCRAGHLRDKPDPGWPQAGRYFDIDRAIIPDAAASGAEQGRTTPRSDHAPFDIEHLIKGGRSRRRHQITRVAIPVTSA